MSILKSFYVLNHIIKRRKTITTDSNCIIKINGDSHHIPVIKYIQHKTADGSLFPRQISTYAHSQTKMKEEYRKTKLDLHKPVSNMAAQPGDDRGKQIWQTLDIHCSNRFKPQN